ncbi:putative DNA-binding transcriptional regulator [Pigmentiphaga humi]|uniref:Putative DNA-binding transcriptional regulator n=1 Tax=Pigmentiphaga humi TaxID=2478468 RepID=A0A3P4B570_9BURK|nr:CerR family C-terminal domain-containing protein [Pigmentiphaga humi]VCU71051.1 putative DNA-binding transcriptional regulator [Pigmentiphaga humi]
MMPASSSSPAYEMLPGSSLFPPARSAQARHALIVAGIAEFSERGVDGASARRIAERAGQNVAAIAYYFGNKEGLYRAIATYAVEVVTRRTGPLLDEIEAYLAGGKNSPARCLDYLLRMLSSTLSGNDELVALTQLIVREQTHPTDAFEILFRGALERPHRVGTALVAAYAGGKADDPSFVIHYHLILSSMLGLRVARQTLLRRTEWTDIGDVERRQIAEILTEHVTATLRSLRSRKTRAAAAKRTRTARNGSRAKHP